MSIKIRNPESLVVSARITKPLAFAIERYLHLNSNVTPSDFIRDAIREKLWKDAPWIMEEMLRPTEIEVDNGLVQVVEKDGRGL